MTLPLAIFLIPYGLFLILYFFMLSFNVYHVRTYGVHGFFSHAVATIFLLGTVLILGGSAIILSGYDWSAPLELEAVTKPFTSTNIFQPL